MNAKIWGAIAVALVLGACGAKEEAAPVVEETPPPAPEVAPAPEATDPAATGEVPADPAATTEPTTEEVPPSQ